MMRNIIFCSVILLICVSFYSCEDKLEPPKSDVASANIPDQESWNSTVVFSDSANVKAILKAGYIAYFSKQGYTLIDSSAVVDFYKNGEKVSTLTGRRGKYYDKNKDIEIFDSVKVVNNEGSTLETDKLYWTNETQRVSSEEFVKIKTPSEEIQGIGFESDQNLKNYTIYKVTGTFNR
jgi:LPS export ABC transporter protein LptC